MSHRRAEHSGTPLLKEWGWGLWVEWVVNDRGLLIVNDFGLMF